MDYQHIEVRDEGEFVGVTLSRPERRNALSEAHLRELLDDFERIARDPEEVNPKGALQEMLQAIEPCAPA